MMTVGVGRPIMTVGVGRVWDGLMLTVGVGRSIMTVGVGRVWDGLMIELRYHGTGRAFEGWKVNIMRVK